jgi:hypothetical protein
VYNLRPEAGAGDPAVVVSAAAAAVVAPPLPVVLQFGGTPKLAKAAASSVRGSARLRKSSTRLWKGSGHQKKSKKVHKFFTITNTPFITKEKGATVT